ncbi:MAG: SusD/RagB family nutrient-binding outer membrane lipoprotein [Paludibacteraceae bacterium]|nr:SusD/RagB family nutrient-binding outer membrane lipoprotein [Paludibacteraceae bacterium]
MKKYISIVSIFALTLGLFGCKDYMDINYDPNSPAEENLTSDMILPAVEMNIAATYSYTLHVLGAYNAQYYAQQFGTPNYVAYSQFNVSATNGSGTYTQLFQRALGNLEIVKKKATESGQNGVLLQATVLRAYAFQLLVDAFGEVPYAEAFDVTNLAPKYDKGEDIYNGLLKELDDALAQVKAGDQVATSYIFPSKSLNDWIGFANAQKLKLLSRMSGVKDVSADIQAVIDGGNLPTADIQIAGCWANASGQANPFFSEEKATWGRATHNIIANLALVGTMKQDTYTDPRLAAWFEPNGSNEFQGSISGTNLSTVEDKYKTTAAWCETKFAYNTPVILIAQTEVEFFLAEFYARKGDAGNAATHYAAAIDASFETAGVAGSAACIAQFPYDQSKWKEVIGISKWVALAGINGFEGYTEARRLDYPAFGAVKGSDMYAGTGALDLTLYVPGTLYTPFQRFDQVGDNHLLERFPYPESSTARNSNSPEFPGYLEPIFWGK